MSRYHLHKIFMVFGVGLAKLMPIVFGAFLAQNFGGVHYTNFVLSLNYSNALAGFSAMGVSPQILRSSACDKPSANIALLSVVGIGVSIFFILLSIIYWIFISKSNFWSDESYYGMVSNLVIILLTMSITFSAISISIKNYQLDNRSAGIISIVTNLAACLLSILTGLIWKNPEIAIVTYAVIMMLFSLYFYLNAANGFPCISNMISYSVCIGYVNKTVKTSLFGVITMSGIYMSNSMFGSNIEQKSIFSISLQLFAVAVFIPGVLGNIVIPQMARTRDQADIYNRYFVKAIFVYLLISFIMALIVYIQIESILGLYKINITSDAKLSVILMQVAAMVASVNATYNQKFVVEGRFYLLAALAVVWVGIVTVLPLLLNITAVNVALSYIFAYIVSILITNVYIKKCICCV